MCKVSIVVPVYKVGKYIENSMKSVCYQTFKDFEVVLVDNNTPDDSIEIAENVLKTTDVKYRVVKQTFQGRPAAREKGFVEAHFKGNDYYYVDCNRGSNSFLDIKLMSLAKVNIMANSTFSYWGAYIGHEQKTVIYPTEWYTNGRPAPAIIINHWIGV